MAGELIKIVTQVVRFELRECKLQSTWKSNDFTDEFDFFFSLEF